MACRPRRRWAPEHAMSALISCGRHGERLPVLACVHLRSTFPKALFVVPADDEWPATAWCGLCEEARLADRGWYDAADAVAQWDWSCTRCLEDSIARAQHTTFAAGPAVQTPEVRSDEV